MSNISCNATNCAYNKNSTCYKLTVKIEGLYSRSKLGTFCDSFEMPNEKKLIDGFYTAKMQNENLESFDTKIKVLCSSEHCMYKVNNHCTAEHINVGMPDAIFPSDTQCDSFKLK